MELIGQLSLVDYVVIVLFCTQLSQPLVGIAVMGS